MKILNNIIIGILLLNVGLFAQNKFSVKDYNNLRVENEIKLSVPNELSDSLWNYLINKYNNENLFLKGIDSSFNTKNSQDIFIDQYYDNKEWKLLKSNSGVRHRKRNSLTNENDKKNGRELMQIKINNIDSNNLDRGEYKYPVKHYDDSDKDEDLHPFLGIVKRKYREEIISKLESYDINAKKLFPTIKMVQNRNRIYVYKDTVAFITITLDSVKVAYLEKKADFIELELELNENYYTKGDSLTKKTMEYINSKIKNDILSRFPQLKQDQTPKYTKGFNKLGIKIKEEKQTDFKSMVLIILSVLILAIILVLVRRRMKKRS